MMRKDWIRWCHHTPICGQNHLIGLKNLVRMTQISWLDAGGPHDTVVLPETKCIWGSLFRKYNPVIWRGDLRTPSTQKGNNNVFGFCHEKTKRMCTFSQYKPGGCAECPEKQQNCNDKRFKTQKRQNRKNCFGSAPDQGVTIVPGPRTAWVWFFFQDVCGDVSESSRLQHVSTVTSLNFQSASMDDKSGSVTWPSPCCWASFLANFDMNFGRFFVGFWLVWGRKIKWDCFEEVWPGQPHLP